MNLPSIFKSVPVMKPTNQITGSKNDKYDMNVPQDMFGLGIQVFKIQSRKQITNSNQGNAKSLGRARQEIKAIQNPVRRTNNPPLVPAIPKPKKTSALLPSINKTPSQKQYRIQGVTKTDSIMSRKSIQKNTNIRQTNKMQAIQQYNQPNYNHARNGPQKNKTFTSSRPVNKSMDAVPQSDNYAASQSQIKPIHKEQWRSSLNILRKFITQANQYVMNQSTKLGRKRNQEYIGQEQNFLQAYITNNPQEYDVQLYDPFSIQNYKISKNTTGFEDNHYEDHVTN